MQNDLEDARAITKNFLSALPTEVSVVALGVMSKSPYKILCAREALIWRLTELSQYACDALEKRDAVAGTTLTRSVFESALVLWRLSKILENRHAIEAEKFNDDIDKILLGSRTIEVMPQSINVKTFVEFFGRTFPKASTIYDRLSEVSHPNWAGAHGMYSTTDREKFVTRFGKKSEVVEAEVASSASILCATLKVTEYAYNKISEDLPVYLGELEKI